MVVHRSHREERRGEVAVPRCSCCCLLFSFWGWQIPVVPDFWNGLE